MELTAKPEWHTPSLVPLTGVRNSEQAKIPSTSEYTFTSTVLRLGTPTLS